jgi:hypothetical protein
VVVRWTRVERTSWRRAKTLLAARAAGEVLRGLRAGGSLLVLLLV